MLSKFPSLPGTYALFLTLSAPTELTIGKLGTFAFSVGAYVYTGSARGPGGLDARMSHHLRPVQRPHWHIDYLRTKAVVTGGVYVVQEEVSAGSTPLECAWSQLLLELPGASVPVAGFGASDCRSGCVAHLLHFLEEGDWAARLQLDSEGTVVRWRNAQNV
jgi:Uri superfamily endonuclease